jgi:hypothetical protein
MLHFGEEGAQDAVETAGCSRLGKCPAPAISTRPEPGISAFSSSDKLAE